MRVSYSAHEVSRVFDPPLPLVLTPPCLSKEMRFGADGHGGMAADSLLVVGSVSGVRSADRALVSPLGQTPGGLPQQLIQVNRLLQAG